MKNFSNENPCPITGKKDCLVKDLVNDHPWLWVGALFVVAVLLGRHRCCRKKCKKN